MQRNDELRPVRGHAVHIDNREKISLTGVTAVESFNENEMLISSEAGAVTLFGSGLHITKLDLDAGNLCVAGFIGGMEYHEQPDKKPGMLSRLFR